MAGTTAKGQLRYPTSTDSPAGHTQIQNLATDCDGQVIPRFTSIANRNTRFTAPVTNDAAIVNGVLHTYYGSAWHWQVRSFTNATSDAGGNLVVAHTLGATPTGATAGRANQATDLLNRICDFGYTTVDATNISWNVRRDDTNAWIATTQVQWAWIAFV